MWSDPLYNDEDGTQIFEGHFPHGASVRQVAHYAQHLKTKSFIEFDYQNEERNLEEYG
jgi:hypothetical protein